jgi:hypothetical protein
MRSLVAVWSKLLTSLARLKLINNCLPSRGGGPCLSHPIVPAQCRQPGHRAHAAMEHTSSGPPFGRGQMLTYAVPNISFVGANID